MTLIEKLEAAEGHCVTCPMTRHADMIADLMRDKSPLRMAIQSTGYDADHMAEDIAGTVQGLWEARQWMKWEKLPPTKKHPLANGRWIPDIAAIKARGE